MRLAAALPVSRKIAIPLREVGLGTPALHVRPKFPLRTSSHRHPLPHVSGSPALRVLRGDPTPTPSFAVLLVVGWAYLAEPGMTRVSQVPDASLHAYHTGGWLDLTRWGLPPHKKRQASLGALTLGFRRGCKPSPASPGWAAFDWQDCWSKRFSYPACRCRNSKVFWLNSSTFSYMGA